MIGVQRQTSNIGVLLETGRTPLYLLGKKQCIKNWVRIAKTRVANSLVIASYDNALENNLQWPLAIKTTLSRVGQLNIFLSAENCRKPPSELFFQRGRDIFHQEAFSEIRKQESKLRTYAKLKTEIGLENYFHQITNIENRVLFSKIRLSNHKLKIEEGRFNKVPKEQRYCPFCPNYVEDEIHFLMQCPVYYTHRAQLMLEAQGERGNQQIEQESLFIFLMTNKEVVHLTAKFITKATKLREDLLADLEIDQ